MVDVYNKNTWSNSDTLSSSGLNNIEDGIEYTRNNIETTGQKATKLRFLTPESENIFANGEGGYVFSDSYDYFWPHNLGTTNIIITFEVDQGDGFWTTFKHEDGGNICKINYYMEDTNRVYITEVYLPAGWKWRMLVMYKE